MNCLNYLTRIIRIIKICARSLMSGKNIVIEGAIKEYNVAADTKIRVGNGGKIYLCPIVTENNVYISAWEGQITIGSNCRFNRNDMIVSRCMISIGEKTIFGPNVCIYDHDHAFDGNGKKETEFRTSPIVIGNNVWIGAGVIILRGAIIGDNSVIGAGCIIKSNIPPNSLVTSQNRALNIVPLLNLR